MQQILLRRTALLKVLVCLTIALFSSVDGFSNAAIGFSCQSRVSLFASSVVMNEEDESEKVRVSRIRRMGSFIVSKIKATKNKISRGKSVVDVVEKEVEALEETQAKETVAQIEKVQTLETVAKIETVKKESTFDNANISIIEGNNLKEKYAAIEDVGERAFTILLDLGIVELTADPTSEDYDTSFDSEIAPHTTVIG